MILMEVSVQIRQGTVISVVFRVAVEAFLMRTAVRSPISIRPTDPGPA
jgi:hypothetical protein